MRQWVVAATLSVSLAAVPCAQAATAPTIVTLRNNGQTLKVAKGSELQLRLVERYRWLAPRVRGAAVRLTPIAFFRNPGYRAWSIAAHALGTAVVTVVGYGEDRAGCDPGPCSPHLFRVTFIVG